MAEKWQPLPNPPLSQLQFDGVMKAIERGDVEPLNTALKKHLLKQYQINELVTQYFKWKQPIQ